MSYQIFADQLDEDSDYDDVALAYEKLGGDRLLDLWCGVIERDVAALANVPVGSVTCYGPGSEWLSDDKRGGVYLCQDISSPKLEFVYIGKAKQFRKRVLNPKHPAAYDHELVLIVLEDEGEIVELEKRLIKQLQPRMNKQHK